MKRKGFRIFILCVVALAVFVAVFVTVVTWENRTYRSAFAELTTGDSYDEVKSRFEKLKPPPRGIHGNTEMKRQLTIYGPNQWQYRISFIDERVTVKKKWWD